IDWLRLDARGALAPRIVHDVHPCLLFGLRRGASSAQDDLVALDRHLVGPQPLARIAFEPSITEPPVPMMPRTAHDLVRNHDLALAERCALVRAGIVDGKEALAEAENRDDAPPGLH